MYNVGADLAFPRLCLAPMLVASWEIKNTCELAEKAETNNPVCFNWSDLVLVIVTVGMINQKTAEAFERSTWHRNQTGKHPHGKPPWSIRPIPLCEGWWGSHHQPSGKVGKRKWLQVDTTCLGNPSCFWKGGTCAEWHRCAVCKIWGA